MSSALARIERAEARHLALYAHAGELAHFGPVCAAYAGPDVPVNMATGIGTAVEAPLAEIEAFYAAHGLPARVVLYSHAAQGLLDALAERGYTLRRILHVYARGLDGPFPDPALLVVGNDGERWSEIATRAFGPGSEAIMRLTAGRAETRLYLAEQGGEAISAGALSVWSGVATLFSTATLPARRGMGGQTALLCARLRDAARLGTDLAGILTAPGSASERNVRRAGFSLVGMRLSFERVR